MPIIVTPYIPTYITVHLGTPDSDAENLTISFREYIKNVASSEVYPTWHNSALRANILAQVSFALNRVYTEFYPSQGYSFNITASTAYDQKFIKGRNIFDSVSTLVDELFTVYIRRQGFVEPLAASFCNGTTTVCEFVEGPNALHGIVNASAKAIEEAGIRAQVGYEVTERVPGEHILKKVSVANAEKGFEENINFFKKYPKGNGGRIEGRLGLHTAFTNSRPTMEKARAIANEYGVGIQIHIAEIPRAFVVEKHGMSAPQILEETGVLGPDVVAAHCIDLTDDDVAILARNKVNIAHTPMTNSFGGNGVARIPYMMEQGLNITLGHDCFFTLDIAEYLRYTFLLHKAYNANAGLLPIFQVLDFALGNAARALGMEGQIGSLTVGKKADILIINPDSPTPVAPCSVLSYFDMTFQGRQVETVIVDGRIVVKDGHSTLVDEEQVMKDCQEQAKIMWRKTGVQI